MTPDGPQAAGGRRVLEEGLQTRPPVILTDAVLTSLRTSERQHRDSCDLVPVGGIPRGSVCSTLRVSCKTAPGHFSQRKLGFHIELNKNRVCFLFQKRVQGPLVIVCGCFLDCTGRRHPLSEKKVVHYMYQLCRALDHMHRYAPETRSSW